MVRAGLPFSFDPAQLSETTASELQKIQQICSSTGGPLAPALERFAKVVATREQTNEELQVAFASPNASSRLVMSLPILVLLGSAISGIPIVSTILSQPIAWVSMGLGIALFTFGKRWVSRILKAAKPTPSDPGSALEMIAIGLRAGMPLSMTKELANAQTEELETMAQTTGAPLADLLTDQAENLRLTQATKDRKRISNASVKVLWPLGLVILPAFVLTAIVPVGLAMLNSK